MNEKNGIDTYKSMIMDLINKIDDKLILQRIYHQIKFEWRKLN